MLRSASFLLLSNCHMSYLSEWMSHFARPALTVAWRVGYTFLVRRASTNLGQTSLLPQSERRCESSRRSQ
jgi:hypothetical protein